MPKGPGSQFNLPFPFTHMLMGYSKNQKPAKDFLRWVHSKPVYDEWFTSQQGYSDGATKDWEKDKVWDADPVLRPFRDIPPFGRLAGYAGPPNRKAAQVVTKYIITDMYAKAIQVCPPRPRSNGRTRRSARSTSEVKRGAAAVRVRKGALLGARAPCS